MQVKGLKKIDNYKKRQDEVKAYLNACEPEDREYFVCQNELQERLVASYLEVDRIIGERGRAIEGDGEGKGGSVTETFLLCAWLCFVWLRDICFWGCLLSFCQLPMSDACLFLVTQTIFLGVKSDKFIGCLSWK